MGALGAAMLACRKEEVVGWSHNADDLYLAISITLCQACLPWKPVHLP